MLHYTMHLLHTEERIMKILIIDDEEPIRDSLTQRLSREGFDVVVAADGLEGLRGFHAERPDLVIIDILMPEMDGLTVLSADS